MRSEVVFVEARASRCVVEVFVNDIPMLTVGTRLAARAATRAHTVVVAGDNRIELRVLSTDDGVGDAAPRALARLVRFREGDVADGDTHGDVLGGVAFPHVALGVSSSSGAGSVRTLATDVAVGAGFGRWSWQDAPILSMTTALVDELEAALVRWAGYFERGDGGGWVAQHTRFLDEHLAAYPGEPRDRVRTQHVRWVESFSPGGRIVIAPRSDWDVRLAAKGRLLDCRCKDATPILTLVEPDGTIVPYPALFGRDGAELVMLRTEGT